MISIMHYIDTNLSRSKREINSSPPSVHKHVQLLTNSEHDEYDYCLSIHSPIKSSEFLRNYLFNSFLKRTVKVAFPRVEIKIYTQGMIARIRSIECILRFVIIVTHKIQKQVRTVSTHPTILVGW